MVGPHQDFVSQSVGLVDSLDHFGDPEAVPTAGPFARVAVDASDEVIKLDHERTFTAVATAVKPLEHPLGEVGSLDPFAAGENP